ncbi:CLUMA_CG017541, isoform A [Clunio marinus]|uniref:N-alpha-acetyltransferase 60 n=1 Tax=Clunio marinus TaxID=568069 RepID=A0A1J1IXL5_9DIPT|nr:CLUMA_CG017541, isoform A [Clunio marinus]
MIWYSEKREDSEMQQILEVSDKKKTSMEKISLRFLVPDDIDEVRLLCEESFPIEYPLSWYEDITHNSTRFYSLAAVYNFAIVGLLVAEIKSWSKLNKEDKTILSESLGRGSSLAYILSLGVHCKYRRSGIATLLLETFIEHLQSSEQNSKIKAIYLHVLTTNQPAILFYERYNFTLHSFLPYYYSIKGKSRDGFCYVCYINGGHQPYHLIDQVRDFCYKILKFNIFSWMLSRIRLVINWFNYHAFSKIHFRQ